MNNNIDSKKPHAVKNCKKFKVACRICQVTGKQKSRTLNSHYALKYHLTTSHDREDEIVSGITRKEILQTARAIEKAIEWNMIIDLPKGDQHHD